MNSEPVLKIAKIICPPDEYKSLLTTLLEFLRIEKLVTRATNKLIQLLEFLRIKSKPVITHREWTSLKSKVIHNENILIEDYFDVHPFANPPIFINAKNVYLNNTGKYFNYYWINKTIFPNNPRFYVNGYIDHVEILESGFEIHMTYAYYSKSCKLSPNNNLLSCIGFESQESSQESSQELSFIGFESQESSQESSQELSQKLSFSKWLNSLKKYKNMLEENKEEALIMSDYQEEKPLKQLTMREFTECNNNPATLLKKISGW